MGDFSDRDDDDDVIEEVDDYDKDHNKDDDDNNSDDDDDCDCGEGGDSEGGYFSDGGMIRKSLFLFNFFQLKVKNN